MKLISQKGWALKKEGWNKFYFTPPFYRTRKEAIKDLQIYFPTKTWRQLRKSGFSCVKVKVQEQKQ